MAALWAVDTGRHLGWNPGRLAQTVHFWRSNPDVFDCPGAHHFRLLAPAVSDSHSYRTTVAERVCRGLAGLRCALPLCAASAPFAPRRASGRNETSTGDDVRVRRTPRS